MQRITWLNIMLEKLWPYVDRAVKTTVKEYLEPLMNEDDYRPASVSSVTFSSFTMGTLPPKLRGVKVYASEQQSEELCLEVDLAWGGNQNIALKFLPKGAAGYLFAAEVGIADLIISGRLRITLKPLIGALPCFGAMDISLVSKPEIDFDLKLLGGDVLSIPGLGDWLRSFVAEVLADLLVYPKKLSIPMIDNLDAMNPCGLFIVKVMEARNLPRADFFSDSDPFAKLTMSDPPFYFFNEESFKKEVRTKTRFNTLNPRWDQVFSLVVHDPREQYVSIHVYDYDTGGGTDLLGTARLALADVVDGQLYDRWIDLRMPEVFQRRLTTRHRLNLSGLKAAAAPPPRPQIRLKYAFNYFERSGADDAVDAGDEAAIRRRQSLAVSDGEFAGLSHGLLTVRVSKAKVSAREGSWLTYVPVVGLAGLVLQKSYYFVVVRIVQVSKYSDDDDHHAPANGPGAAPAPAPAAWRPESGLYQREDAAQGEQVDDDDAIAFGAEGWGGARDVDDDGAEVIPGMSVIRTISTYSLGMIGLAESRKIKKKDVLFKSRTSAKPALDVGDIVWGESFEYVLSENDYDETRQITQNREPMEVVIQLILKIKDQFGLRREVRPLVPRGPPRSTLPRTKRPTQHAAR